MIGDPLDRELERVAHRHANETLKLSFKDFIVFFFEAVGALVPIGVAIATGRMRLAVLVVVVIVATFIGAWIWLVRSMRRTRKVVDRGQN